MSLNWNVIVSDFRCPHKYDEMHDSKWSKLCDLTRKPCNIENCTKRPPDATGKPIEKFLKDLLKDNK